jgi:hypothetical protein
MTWAPRVLAWRRGWFAAIRSVISGEHYRIAEVLGMRPLNENLSPLQRHQYAKSRSFEVVGGTTGRRYRIQHGRLMNIEEPLWRRIPNCANHSHVIGIYVQESTG